MAYTLKQKIRKALDEKEKGQALYTAMKRGRDKRSDAIETMPEGDSFREEIKEIKQKSIASQDELVAQFMAQAQQRGASVFLAQDGPEAVDHVLRIVHKHNAKSVAKSKSLTSEEIEINHPLEEAGLEVIETDLGELIIQKLKEKPFHLVFPAVHKTASEVADLFTKLTDVSLTEDVQEIMKVVRQYLRPIFLNADIGLTGANIAIADTGAIAIETNEGNARLVTSIPDVHICIVGIEKIVPSFKEAVKLALAHPLSAVGQFLTTYVTFMAGRNPLGEDQQEMERETHIILLDNGRSRMRNDAWYDEALHCIRCGACMNICPTYGVVGGHTFGYIYPGPIGIPWTANVHGLEKANEFADLCISCGLCQEICPADINIPMMIAKTKHEYHTDHPQPMVNRFLMKAETMAKMGSMTAPISNWFIRNPLFRAIMEKCTGIERTREIPPFSRITLTKWYKKHKKHKPTQEFKRKVAFFTDIYANYNRPDIGKQVVTFLERCGCEVLLPDQKSCGYPYIGYGALDRAKEMAQYNVDHFASLVNEGCDIVTTEPTAAYCLIHSYPKLLDNSESSIQVSSHTFELFDYLNRLLDEQLIPDYTLEDHKLGGKHFGFHLSCHQRPLSAGKATMEWLRKMGAKVSLIETGTCCGMAGTFGMKSGELGYELSQAVGEPLFKAFNEADVDAIVTESSVCRIHLREGTRYEVFHPLELLSL